MAFNFSDGGAFQLSRPLSEEEGLAFKAFCTENAQPSSRENFPCFTLSPKRDSVTIELNGTEAGADDYVEALHMIVMKFATPRGIALEGCCASMMEDQIAILSVNLQGEIRVGSVSLTKKFMEYLQERISYRPHCKFDPDGSWFEEG